MTTDSTFFTTFDAVSVPLEPSDPPARVVAGAPRCAEKVITDIEGLEVGIWEVTPGRFLSAKPTVGEVMYFIAGSGTLTHADGSVTEIGPGVTVSLEKGWSGEWDVVDTVRKVYVIYSSTPAAPTN